jgi:peptidoglycan/xylan/chitin deacetylase (PgdA/CDA1 family)
MICPDQGALKRSAAKSALLIDHRAKAGRFTILQTADLKPHPRNPRKHTREQIRAIARSIEAFGFNTRRFRSSASII